MKPECGHQAMFCLQSMLWKSLLCKFKWRLRGVHTSSTLIGVSACTCFCLLLCFLAGLNNVNCYARPRHLTSDETMKLYW